MLRGPRANGFKIETGGTRQKIRRVPTFRESLVGGETLTGCIGVLHTPRKIRRVPTFRVSLVGGETPTGCIGVVHTHQKIRRARTSVQGDARRLSIPGGWAVPIVIGTKPPSTMGAEMTKSPNDEECTRQPGCTHQQQLDADPGGVRYG